MKYKCNKCGMIVNSTSNIPLEHGKMSMAMYPEKATSTKCDGFFYTINSYSKVETGIVKKCNHFNPKPKNREEMIAKRKETMKHGKERRKYKGRKGGFPKKKDNEICDLHKVDISECGCAGSLED